MKEVERESKKQLVDQCQAYFRTAYTKALTEGVSKESMISYLKKYLRENNIHFMHYKEKELIIMLYEEMCEYSVITKYINDNEVEEININAWNDIEIRFSNGTLKKLEETFLSPEHGADKIKKMLRDDKNNKNILDESTPIIRGHLGENVRITTSAAPILDRKRGIQASIRKINPKKLKKDDFVKLGTVTEEIHEFLSGCLNAGISMCVTGSTDAGKTTMLASLLSQIPDETRLITIENETREFDLVKEDVDGVIKNNVVHWVTNKDYDQETLLEYALTSDPTIICMGEMKSHEAFAAQEASRTGHAVITTTHANSARATYSRMATLCQLKSNIDFQTLYYLCAESFPIVVFMRKMKDNSRKIMEVIECESTETGKIRIQTLYKYVINEEKLKEEIITGEFRKENHVSEALRRRILESGFNIDFLS